VVSKAAIDVKASFIQARIPDCLMKAFRISWYSGESLRKAAKEAM
jgi:hypothetical protein